MPSAKNDTRVMASWPTMILALHSRAGGSSFTRSFRFVTVGGTGVVINSLTLVVLHGIWVIPLIFAVPMAVEASILNNFCWNNIWTFSDRSAPGAFFRFNMSCIGGLILSTATVELCVRYLDIHYLVSNLTGIVLAASWNFFFSNTWAWKQQEPV